MRILKDLNWLIDEYEKLVSNRPSSGIIVIKGRPWGYMIVTNKRSKTVFRYWKGELFPWFSTNEELFNEKFQLDEYEAAKIVDFINLLSATFKTKLDDSELEHTIEKKIENIKELIERLKS